jgi:hypothetical protein
MIQHLPVGIVKAQSGIDYPWTNPHYDSAGTGFASEEHTLTPPLTNSLTIQTNKLITSNPSLLIAGGLIFVETNEGIWAYKTSDQSETWCYSDLAGINSPPDISSYWTSEMNILMNISCTLGHFSTK